MRSPLSPTNNSSINKPASTWKSLFTLSEETREVINRITEYGKRAIHYGWIPLILLLGFWKSDPRPPLMRMLNPLS